MLVKHGGTFVRVHTCRLARYPSDCNKNISSVHDPCDSKTEDETSGEKDSDDSDDDEIEKAPLANGENIATLDVTEPDVVENIEINNGEVQSVECDEGSSRIDKNISVKHRVKKGDIVKGIQNTTGEYVAGKVLSRAGKVTGKYKNCFNIKSDSNGETMCVNLDDLSEISVSTDCIERVVMFNSSDVVNAKESEIQNWRKNEVYEEVDDIGQEVLSMRWVVTEKVKNEKLCTKARLVVRGFEEETEDLRKYSPTCSKEGIRIAFSLAASKQWPINAIDVQAAYLQGYKIDREVYVRPPPEYFEGKLWRLKKTVYGLCDAARAWYLRVKNELLNLSAKPCSLDSSLFYWYKDGVLHGIICVYVDDFLWAGTSCFEKCVIAKIHELFMVGHSATESFKYVGLNINTVPDLKVL